VNAPRSASRRESGAALLVTMVIMVALALLAISTLGTVMGDQQVSGFQTRGRMAFHAAEAGLATVLANMNGAQAPVIPTAALGDASLYPYGQPAYGPDLTVANPVTDLGALGAQGMNLRIGSGGPRYQVQYWRLNLAGSAPGGSISRIELATGVLRGS
jgi:hypothetical protein